MQDPRAILSELDAVRAEALQRLESATRAQLDARPAPTPHNSGAWSLGELFMHIAGDEIYLRELIARPLLEGVLPPEGVGFVPPPPAAGLPKDVIAFWFQRARAETRRLLLTWPADADLNARHDGGLVAVFGGAPMNALEWLESYGGHEAFHHRQIDAVRQDLSSLEAHR